MIKIRTKRKNPESDIKSLLDNLEPYEDIKFIKISQGGFGETYRFFINNSKKLSNNQILYSGEYLLKRQLHNKLNISEIKKLELLSKYGLIPKIFFISEKYQIMEYIKSNNLFQLTSIHKISDEKGLILLKKIKQLIKNWHKLGYCHGDLRNLKNYLVTSSNKVYIIDPATHYECDYNKDLRDLDYVERVFTEDWDDWEDSYNSGNNDYDSNDNDS